MFYNLSQVVTIVLVGIGIEICEIHVIATLPHCCCRGLGLGGS